MTPRRPTPDDGPATPAPGAPGAETLGDIGQQLGPYRILQLLGQGGMGRIFLAERSDAYRQQVAVKILRRGLDSEEMRWRFRRERQVLASLEHPYIARLYDGGTTLDGRPYLVMERVEGNPIDRHCDDQRLSIDERLRLFTKVCKAVAVAHRNLLVHRDLKPNNILVSDDGTPKLLDFGIAKPLVPIADPAETTGTQGPLTPGYASPEQILGGAITTASDVYSLGVLLYRLLCGRSPRRSARDLLDERTLAPASQLLAEAAADESESLQPIVAQRRISVDGLRKRLRGDLDHILLKALHHHPSQRYPSAQEMVRDLERHLAGFPISARPDSLLYLVGKFLKRNRRTSAIFGALLVVLLGGLLRVETARRQAEVERQRAHQVQGFLVEIFDHGTTTPPPSPRQLMDLAMQRFQRLAPLEKDVEIALLDALGRLYGDLAEYERAYELSSQAVVEHRRLHGADHVGAAPLLVNLAHIEQRQGRSAAAELHYGEAHDLATRRWPNRHRRQRAERTANDALYGISSVFWDQGKRQECIELLEEVLEQRRRLYVAPHRRIAEVASDLATLYIADGRIEDGRALLEEALEMRRQSLGERHPDMFFSLDSLALLHYQTRDYAAAEGIYRENLALQSEFVDTDHPRSQLTRRHLARTLLKLGKLEEAQQILQELVARERQQVGERLPLAESLQLLGRVLTEQGKSRQALPHLQEALDLFQLAFGTDRLSHAYDLLFLAQAEADLRMEVAIHHFREAIRLFTEHDHVDRLGTQYELSLLLLDLQRPQEAMDEADLALRHFDTPGVDADPWRRWLYEGIRGASLTQLGRTEAARPLLRQALEVLEEALGENHRATLDARRWCEAAGCRRDADAGLSSQAEKAK